MEDASGFDKKITRWRVSSLLQRSAAVSKTSRSIFNALRLMLAHSRAPKNYQQAAIAGILTRPPGRLNLSGECRRPNRRLVFSIA
jgi:hypothetical protein